MPSAAEDEVDNDAKECEDCHPTEGATGDGCGRRRSILWVRTQARARGVGIRGDRSVVEVKNLPFLEIGELDYMRTPWKVARQVEELLWSIGVWSVDVSVECLLGTAIETDAVQPVEIGGGAVKGDSIPVESDRGFAVGC
jgi:hypothetical protein